MKQANFIFSGYNKKDELIESFIIEDRTEHEANNEAMHYVEAHQSINDWSLTPTPVKETEQPEQPYYKGKGEHSVNQLEAICSQYKEYVSFLNSRGNDTTPTSKEGLEDSEIRVYGIDSNLHDGKIFDLTNNDFVHIAEEQGYVWTLAGFESAFNSEEIAYDMFIRFINPVKEQL